MYGHSHLAWPLHPSPAAAQPPLQDLVFLKGKRCRLKDLVKYVAKGLKKEEEEERKEEEGQKLF